MPKTDFNGLAFKDRAELNLHEHFNFAHQLAGPSPVAKPGSKAFQFRTKARHFFPGVASCSLRNGMEQPCAVDAARDAPTIPRRRTRMADARKKGMTYADAGVNFATHDKLVTEIFRRVRSTYGPRVLGGRRRLRRPVLAAERQRPVLAQLPQPGAGGLHRRRGHQAQAGL